MMPNGDPRDGFFDLTLTLINDSYILFDRFGIVSPPSEGMTQVAPVVEHVTLTSYFRVSLTQVIKFAFSSPILA